MGTNQKHTPGPWYVAADPHPKATHPEARKFAHNLHRFVATGPELDDEGTHAVVCSMMDGPEQVANAALISAAPDLLAAAETALADIKQTANFDTGDSQTLATVAALEAAIAKAKGEA